MPSLSNQKLQYLVVFGSVLKAGCVPSARTAAAIIEKMRHLPAMMLRLFVCALTEMLVPKMSTILAGLLYARTGESLENSLNPRFSNGFMLIYSNYQF